jgi:hypothetical protein
MAPYGVAGTGKFDSKSAAIMVILKEKNDTHRHLDLRHPFDEVGKPHEDSHADRLMQADVSIITGEKRSRPEFTEKTR